MDNYKYLDIKKKSKDNSKGHKIAAALYLVTNHLSDNDPLKMTIRTHAVNLVAGAHDHHIENIAEHISTLLETAVLAHLISEKNASIISLELRHYVVSINTETSDISALFTPVFNDPVIKNPSHIKLSFNQFE